MPDLNFEIAGVEPVTHGLTPLVHFKLRLTTLPPGTAVQAVILNVQIQLQAPQRQYSATEKERLLDLFGPPERWGQTLRNRLWAQVHTSVAAFVNCAEAIVSVPCSYDLNLASTKYFFALETGEVSLLFLFSGSIFSVSADGRLQVEPISWDKECVYHMPVHIWHGLMEQHYPNSAWVSVRRDLFSQLYAFRRRNGLATWDDTLERLLASQEQQGGPQVSVSSPLTKASEVAA